MNADGGGIRRLTKGENPRWSPDGLTLVYRHDQGGLAVINIDGTHQKRFALPLDDSDSPDWSPDGRRIVFSTLSGDYVMSADGTDVRRLPTGPSSGGQLRWSPDGKQLLFTREFVPIAKREQIWMLLMNADGTHVRRLFRFVVGFSANQYTWSPDGKKIATTQCRTQGVCFVALGSRRETGIEVKLPGARCCDTIDWQPLRQRP